MDWSGQESAPEAATFQGAPVSKWREYRLNEPDWTVIFAPIIVFALIFDYAGCCQIVGNVLK